MYCLRYLCPHIYTQKYHNFFSSFNDHQAVAIEPSFETAFYAKENICFLYQNNIHIYIHYNTCRKIFPKSYMLFVTTVRRYIHGHLTKRLHK